jgi:hypothetical protein
VSGPTRRGVRAETARCPGRDGAVCRPEGATFFGDRTPLGSHSFAVSALRGRPAPGLGRFPEDRSSLGLHSCAVSWLGKRGVLVERARCPGRAGAVSWLRKRGVLVERARSPGQAGAVSWSIKNFALGTEAH